MVKMSVFRGCSANTSSSSFRGVVGRVSIVRRGFIVSSLIFPITGTLSGTLSGTSMKTRTSMKTTFSAIVSSTMTFSTIASSNLVPQGVESELSNIPHGVDSRIVSRNSVSSSSSPVSTSSLANSTKGNYITSSPGFILLGAPGGGKGTISKKFLSFGGCEIIHISVGDLLREEIRAESPLGLQIQASVDNGKLASEDLVRETVVQEILKHNTRRNDKSSIDSIDSRIFMFDGIPRTIEQAEFLDSMMSIEFAIQLDVPDKEIVSRVSSRWVHAPSNRVYNYLFNPPKVEGVDDVTGEQLTRRADDAPEIVEERLSLYREKSQAILKYYETTGNHRLTTGNSNRLYRFEGSSNPDLINQGRRSDAIFKEIMEGPLKEMFMCGNAFDSKKTKQEL